MILSNAECSGEYYFNFLSLSSLSLSFVPGQTPLRSLHHYKTWGWVAHNQIFDVMRLFNYSSPPAVSACWSSHSFPEPFVIQLTGGYGYFPWCILGLLEAGCGTVGQNRITVYGQGYWYILWTSRHEGFGNIQIEMMKHLMFSCFCSYAVISTSLSDIPTLSIQFVSNK